MKLTSNHQQLKKEWGEFKTGCTKLRTWHVDPVTNARTMSYKGIDDIKKEKASALKKIRADELKMSQKELADAIHVSPRTLQGWEIGKSITPEPVLILLKLMRDMPAVRKKLALA